MDRAKLIEFFFIVVPPKLDGETLLSGSGIYSKQLNMKTLIFFIALLGHGLSECLLMARFGYAAG